MSVYFKTYENLREWLASTTPGRRIIDEELERLVSGTVPCLLVMSADGYVEVFGPRQLRVKTVNRLHVSSMDSASLADEYLARTLHRSYRRWYEQRHLRGGGCLRTVRAEDELQRRLDVEWLGTCRSLKDTTGDY